MSDYVTNDDLNKALDKALKKQTEEISEVLQVFMHQVDERFNKVEKDISDIKVSLDKLTNTIDGFLKRLDEVETEQAARDAQFERLLEWAREVSEKTGIPLKGL